MKRSDTGQEGVRSGQRTTVRNHFMAVMKQLESLWVVSGYQRRSECVRLWIHVCVRVIQRQREGNRTAPVGSAWWSFDKNTEGMISHIHFLFPQQEVNP